MNGSVLAIAGCQSANSQSQGIIHNCTHKDSDSATFRMTEDKMFIAIFNYIEHLFAKIKPKKLFFMAIDGVAPRAKMNQQRARRFRTALEAEKAREKAIREGAQMPTEDAFDSNCITPGTDFMARLTQQLRYFINKKVSEDTDWQGVEVILSGHEVPGEGEHKIMEYIRLSKAQADYNPNMRHCLYGLDADLIMLGLLSHDPHFCLLREEVTFGRQSKVKSKELEHQNFYLMHLCIVREYLELEFAKLKEPDALSFPFDLERIIDDFILMAFFVGNDFLPNLPNLHINEGALAVMFKVYSEILPKAGGYINESGVINLERLGLLLDELSRVEHRFFEHEVQDANWFKGKQMERDDVMSSTKRGKVEELTMSTAQKELFTKVKRYVQNRPPEGMPRPLDMPASLNAEDRAFIGQLADALHLQWKTVEDDAGNRHLRLTFPEKVMVDDDDDDYDGDEEAQLAVGRIIKRYDNAKIVDMTAQEAKALSKSKADKIYEDKFRAWKDKFYKGKFEWGLDNEEEMRKLAENYVQGLQWVLFYYYRGIASWPWFFRYHYSPMISDVKKGLQVDMNFQLGQPFLPYQQLMGVLPDRSKKIVPTTYHDLMTNPNSPIIDFYPRNFELDMNGKKQDWEAVVKIPFIDEERLLSAMATKDDGLTPEEKARNTFGVQLKFTYSADLDFTFQSSLPGIFPDLQHCRCVENIFDLPPMDGLNVHVGLINGVKLGVSALAGFPSLYTIPHEASLDKHQVNVFQQDSRNDSMVLTIIDAPARGSIEYAKKQLGQKIYVGYPFLSEAKVVRVSDELFDYALGGPGRPPVGIPHGPAEIEMWHKKASGIVRDYSKRLGIVIGDIESLVHVEALKGLMKTDDGASIKEFGTISGIDTDYATQMVVDEVESEDQRFIEKAALPIEEEFPIGTRAFALSGYGYGRPLEVTSHFQNRADVHISIPSQPEPDFASQIISRAEKAHPYTPSFAVAKSLGLNPLTLSKLTASFSIDLYGTRVNLGLNLKFEAKKLKVLGYSRRGDNGWEFSEKAIDLVRQYMIQFPEFVAKIQSLPKGDIYAATDFFPEGEALAKIKEIQAWLKTIESKSLEKVPLEAEQLDSEVVLMLEKAADQYLQITGNASGKKVKGMPRKALLKPTDAEHRLGNQHFSVGHRVVYVQDSGKVPIASKGTVIGLTRTARVTLLDVVFDTTFMSGTTLNDRCSPFRGATVPSSSVLNVSQRQLEIASNAGQNRRPQQAYQPIVAQGSYSSVGGFAQLIPAGTPAPLHGSFRNAVNGMNNRGRGGMNGPTLSISQQQYQLPYRAQVNGNRGRGQSNGNLPSRGPSQSLNRQGYKPIPRDDVDFSIPSQNPNFVARPQNRVPPPADLDNSSSRGRGRGRGRGETGRGLQRGRAGRGNRGRGHVNGAVTTTAAVATQ